MSITFKPSGVYALLLLLIACGSLNSNGTDGGGNGGIQDMVVTDLEVPWAMDFLPDGKMIFTERPGEVKLSSDDDVTTVGQIEVADVGEAGLLGIAVDPEFNQNRYVYIYYSYNPDEITNRISRFTLDDSLRNETILLDSIPGSRIHNGGRLKFGPDGYLYATTGDAGSPEIAGNTQTLGGKILRMERDGSTPQDNPFGNYVWALGLRNPQGLAWHENGTLYASEHGPNRRDAIREIERGVDYGWPQTCEETPSVRCYTEFTLAPSGIAIVGDYLYAAGLRGNQLRRVNLQNDNDEELLSGQGRLRDVVYHNEVLYISTSNRDGRGNPGPEDDRIFTLRP
ncbi:MAG: PQQ-dependent sugar dehydrogenase [Chitinispirillaceae bacterium]